MKQNNSVFFFSFAIHRVSSPKKGTPASAQSTIHNIKKKFLNATYK